MVIKELLVSLGFEFSDESEKEVDKFNKEIKDAAKNIGLLVAGTVAAGAAIVGFVSKMSKGVDEIGKASEKIGISVEELDAYRHAAEITTGSADGLISNMERLSRISSEAARGIGSGVEAFGMLGISVTGADGKVKSINDLFLETSDAIGQLESKSLKLELAEKLGLGGLDLLLDKGSAGIKQLTDEAKRLGVVTTEDAAKAAKFNDELFRVFRTVQKVAIEIAGELMPLADTLVGMLKKFVPMLRSLIKSIKFLVDAIGGVDVALRFVLGTLALILAFQIGKMMQGLWGMLGMLIVRIHQAGTAALLANAKAMAGFVLIGALLSIIVLAIQDMTSGFQFFNKLSEKNPWIEETLEPVAEMLLSIWDMIKAVIKLLSDPLSGDAWKTFFDEVKDAGTKFISALFDSFQNHIDRILRFISMIPGLEDVGKASQGTGDVSLGEIQDQMANMLLGTLGINQDPTMPAPAGGGGTMNTTTNIVINGGSDSKEAIAKQVGIEVGNMNRDALKNMRKGVKK